MVTKITRDVMDVRIRPITDGIDIDGDCSANFAIDGVPIGLTVPCDAAFTNLNVTNFTVTGTVDGTGSTLIGTFNATYADIAERYESDKAYPAGTVVCLGGEKEITESDAACQDVFGVVSSAPAYVLNSGQEGLSLPVALIGRVPVRVIGPVRRGDRLVSSHVRGVARAMLSGDRQGGLQGFGRVLADDDLDAERSVEAAIVTLK